jgi:tetratricopeptide (TPR) repeat protein
MNENFQLKHYGLNRDMFKLDKIADKFQSLHSRDFLFLSIVLIVGFAIDGLYGMGHFLSFGIAVIASIQVITLKKKIQNSKVRNLLIGMIFLVIVWHGVVKVSIWQGLEQFEKNKYSSAISHLERAVKMYPKPIGRFHLILGQMYLENGEIEKARSHAIRAQNINPHHDAPVKLLQKINTLE